MLFVHDYFASGTDVMFCKQLRIMNQAQPQLGTSVSL